MQQRGLIIWIKTLSISFVSWLFLITVFVLKVKLWPLFSELLAPHLVVSTSDAGSILLHAERREDLNRLSSATVLCISISHKKTLNIIIINVMLWFLVMLYLNSFLSQLLWLSFIIVLFLAGEQLQVTVTVVVVNLPELSLPSSGRCGIAVAVKRFGCGLQHGKGRVCAARQWGSEAFDWFFSRGLLGSDWSEFLQNLQQLQMSDLESSKVTDCCGNVKTFSTNITNHA